LGGVELPFPFSAWGAAAFAGSGGAGGGSGAGGGAAEGFMSAVTLPLGRADPLGISPNLNAPDCG